MNNSKQTNGGMNARTIYRKNGEYAGLARWLQEVLLSSEEQEPFPNGEYEDARLKLAGEKDYHPTFSKQIPDFVMSLLANDSLATVRHASLLFHMAGCSTCHNTYLDAYSSMSAMIHPLSPSPVP